mmetsp:Transcript_9205/g.19952  ORF Transcript_9205/g.19952 Transcript_9205/m.19952 type:complete len:365 (-) Transcript_9205:654-1748(-)
MLAKISVTNSPGQRRDETRSREREREADVYIAGVTFIHTWHIDIVHFRAPTSGDTRARPSNASRAPRPIPSRFSPAPSRTRRGGPRPPLPPLRPRERPFRLPPPRPGTVPFARPPRCRNPSAARTSSRTRCGAAGGGPRTPAASRAVRSTTRARASATTTTPRLATARRADDPRPAARTAGASTPRPRRGRRPPRRAVVPPSAAPAATRAAWPRWEAWPRRRRRRRRGASPPSAGISGRTIAPRTARLPAEARRTRIWRPAACRPTPCPGPCPRRTIAPRNAPRAAVASFPSTTVRRRRARPIPTARAGTRRARRLRPKCDRSPWSSGDRSDRRRRREGPGAAAAGRPATATRRRARRIPTSSS